MTDVSGVVYSGRLGTGTELNWMGGMSRLWLVSISIEVQASDIRLIRRPYLSELGQTRVIHSHSHI